jgi:hypothetical protein
LAALRLPPPHEGRQLKTILICSDCGHPQNTSLGNPVTLLHRLITMLLVVLIGGVALSVSMLTDFKGRDSFTLQDKPER